MSLYVESRSRRLKRQKQPEKSSSCGTLHHRQQLAEVEEDANVTGMTTGMKTTKKASSSSTSVNLVAGWRPTLIRPAKTPTEPHCGPFLCIRCRPDRSALAPPSAIMPRIILINILIQPTLEAYQRDSAITLIGRWNRVADKYCTNAIRCPLAVVIKPARLYTPAVIGFHEPYRLRPPGSRRGIVMNIIAASGSEVKVQLVIVLGIILQHLHHRGGSDRDMAGKIKAIIMVLPISIPPLLARIWRTASTSRPPVRAR